MNIAGQRVLVFGDSLSHVGPDNGPEAVEITRTGSYSSPGAILAQKLLQAGASAARVDARVGRSAYNFWGREATGALLQADLAWKPTLVIVMLGTNDLGLNMVRDMDAMGRILRAFAPTAEVWGIGPPSFASGALQVQTGPVVAMMQSVFEDRFVDARGLSTQPEGRTADGVHFTRAGAEAWARGLAQTLLTRLRERPEPGGPSRRSPLALAGWGLVVLVGALVGVGIKRRRRRALPAA